MFLASLPCETSESNGLNCEIYVQTHFSLERMVDNSTVTPHYNALERCEVTKLEMSDLTKGFES